jgi:hypothetical protein
MKLLLLSALASTLVASASTAQTLPDAAPRTELGDVATSMTRAREALLKLVKAVGGKCAEPSVIFRDPAAPMVLVCADGFAYSMDHNPNSPTGIRRIDQLP